MAPGGHLRDRFETIGGLGDLSNLHRSLRRRFGLTPSEVRAEAIRGHGGLRPLLFRPTRSASTNAVMAGWGAPLNAFGHGVRQECDGARSRTDSVISETDTGKLFCDTHGIAAGGGVHFATLAVNLDVTNADFLIV